MKGALLQDPKRILVQQTKNVQAARQIRFASLGEINRQKAALRARAPHALSYDRGIA
jgi:uncharacterized protein YdeI (YjbR/CyaY-like superfamily)